MTDTNYFYSMLRSSIMWLEKYIEVAQYYPDWKQRKQTDDSSIILWVKEDTPKNVRRGTVRIPRGVKTRIL